LLFSFANKTTKEAIQRGKDWAKFRATEKKTGGLEFGMKKVAVVKPTPAEATKLVYGGVSILKRDSKNDSKKKTLESVGHGSKQDNALQCYILRSKRLD